VLVVEAVTHDRAQPRLEVRALVERMDTSDRTNQRLLKEIIRAIAIAAQRACKGTQSRDGFHHAVLQRGIEAHRVHSGSWQPESIHPTVRRLFSDCSNQFAVATMAASEGRQGTQMVCARASVFCPTAPHPWGSSARCRRPGDAQALPQSFRPLDENMI